MKDIKFKVWDKKLNKFIPFNQLGTFFDDESLEFLMFTGLKDDNNHEIYEGDILMKGTRKEYNHYWIYLVKTLGGQFGNQLFFLTYKDNLSTSEDGDFWTWKERIREPNDRNGGYLRGGKDIKIIGNIFENSNLLLLNDGVAATI